jgi:plasmid stabilization system protein ParE
MRVRLTLAAQRDLSAQIGWLKDRSPKAGRRAATAITRSLDLLKTFPDLGAALRFEVREQHVRFGVYGFVIEYERHPRMIVVRRIYHGAQDRSRLP